MKAKIAISALLIGLLFLANGCIEKPEKEFGFEWESSGATYKSDFAEPKGLLGSFSIRQKIILAPEIHFGENNANSEIFNWSVIPFYTVMAGNDKNAIQLIQFMGHGIKKKCITNFGDLKTEESLDETGCNALIEKWSDELVIFLPLPDPSLRHSFIEASENRVWVRARNTQEQATLAKALSRKLFPNTDEVLEKASETFKKLN